MLFAICHLICYFTIYNMYGDFKMILNAYEKDRYRFREGRSLLFNILNYIYWYKYHKNKIASSIYIYNIKLDLKEKWLSKSK